MAAIEMALEAARNRDFAPTIYVEYLGDPLPLTGGTVKMEIRLYGGAGGAALAADTSVDFTDQDTGRTETDPEDGLVKPVRQLVLEPVVAKSAIAALPGQDSPDAGDAQVFEHEIMAIYADTNRDSLVIGDLIVFPGVVA